MKLFVGNLPYGKDSAALKVLFEAYGTVTSANVVTDRDTGKSKGFGFVEMSDADAEEAISQLCGTDWDGRTIMVETAKPKAPRR